MTRAALETVRLADEEAGLDATFVPGAGMICCSLRHRGQELLAQNAGLAAYAEGGHTMGIPLLYPWANRLAGFDYSVGGRTVHIPHDPRRVHVDGNGLPMHGVIGGRMAWELTPALAALPRSLSARLSWTESEPELFELFPFRHELEYRARLTDGRLEIDLTVHATGGHPVPLAFGFHPYLTLPGVPRERWHVELPAMRRLSLDDQQIPIGPDKALSTQRFELAERALDDAFDQVPEPSRFTVASAGRRVEIEFAQGYPCAQVFAPRTAQSICFEPMTAPANALRSATGIRLLGPGESGRASFSVGITEPPSEA
jgi:galactose mutarotase-like enzyme